MPEAVKKIRPFVNTFWDLAKNHKKGIPLPYEYLDIGITTQQQINAEKQVGINTENYRHILSSDFIKHIYDNHGNMAVEKSRGNIAIQEADFDKIPSILHEPDFIITGIVYKNENRTLYAKTFTNTTVFVEQLQARRKTLSAKTFYQAATVLQADEILYRMGKDKRYNVENAKIMSGMGGNPHSPGGHNAVRAAAKSAVPPTPPAGAGPSGA